MSVYEKVISLYEKVISLYEKVMSHDHTHDYVPWINPVIQVCFWSVTSCNTPQHTALHCNTLQHTATYRSTLQHRTSVLAVASCNVVQPAATHCNNLWRTATTCDTLQYPRARWQLHLATHCNTLHHTATHCNKQQHTATRSNTLYDPKSSLAVVSCDIRVTTRTPSLSLSLFLTVFLALSPTLVHVPLL